MLPGCWLITICGKKEARDRDSLGQGGGLYNYRREGGNNMTQQFETSIKGGREGKHWLAKGDGSRRRKAANRQRCFS